MDHESDSIAIVLLLAVIAITLLAAFFPLVLVIIFCLSLPFILWFLLLYIISNYFAKS